MWNLSPRYGICRPPRKKNGKVVLGWFQVLSSCIWAVLKKNPVIQKTGWLRVRDFPIGLKYVNKTHYNP